MRARLLPQESGAVWEESWGAFGCCLFDNCCLLGRLMTARLHQRRQRQLGW